MYHASMRKPLVSKPRTASAMFILSSKLPRLKLPTSSLELSPMRPRPRVSRPSKSPRLASLASSLPTRRR